MLFMVVVWFMLPWYKLRVVGIPGFLTTKLLIFNFNFAYCLLQRFFPAKLLHGPGRERRRKDHKEEVWKRPQLQSRLQAAARGEAGRDDDEVNGGGGGGDDDDEDVAGGQVGRRQGCGGGGGRGGGGLEAGEGEGEEQLLFFSYRMSQKKNWHAFASSSSFMYAKCKINLNGNHLIHPVSNIPVHPVIRRYWTVRCPPCPAVSCSAPPWRSSSARAPPRTPRRTTTAAGPRR